MEENTLKKESPAADGASMAKTIKRQDKGMAKTNARQGKRLSQEEISYLAKQDINLQIRWILYLQHEIQVALGRIERMKRHLKACG